MTHIGHTKGLSVNDIDRLIIIITTLPMNCALSLDLAVAHALCVASCFGWACEITFVARNCEVGAVINEDIKTVRVKINWSGFHIDKLLGVAAAGKSLRTEMEDGLEQ